MRLVRQGSRTREQRRTGRAGLLGGPGKAELAFSGERKAGGIGCAGAGAGAGARSSGGGCSRDAVGESLAFLAGRGEGEDGESEDMLCDFVEFQIPEKMKAYIDPLFFIFEFWRRI